jgi:hypothetical protein
MQHRFLASWSAVSHAKRPTQVLAHFCLKTLLSAAERPFQDPLSTQQATLQNSSKRPKNAVSGRKTPFPAFLGENWRPIFLVQKWSFFKRKLTIFAVLGSKTQFFENHIVAIFWPERTAFPHRTIQKMVWDRSDRVFWVKIRLEIFAIFVAILLLKK